MFCPLTSCVVGYNSFTANMLQYSKYDSHLAKMMNHGYFYYSQWMTVAYPFQGSIDNIFD
jgi:hypothetical protein